MRSVRVIMSCVVVMIMTLSACSDDSTSVTVAPDPTVGSSSDETPSTGAGTGSTGTTAVGEEPEQVGEQLIAGLPQIVQLTPLAGGGPRPSLDWEPVEGAIRYDVTLYAPDGIGYWAWHGPETSVVVGELATPDQSGPRVSPGMSWALLAFDADGLPIASSALRPIDP
jgi:hypothetical protein